MTGQELKDRIADIGSFYGPYGPEDAADVQTSLQAELANLKDILVEIEALMRMCALDGGARARRALAGKGMGG